MMSNVAFFRRHVALWLSLSWALAQPLSAAETQTNAAPKPAPRRPSILFILADDLGYGDLGCYGQTKIKTPNLDKLASEGIRFTDFYAGSTVCAPSRCALMTGLHTGHALVRGNANVPLASGNVTLARLLKDSGYHTGLVGKWGLGDENTSGVPQKQGFDEFAGFLNQTHAHDYYPDHIWRYDSQSGYDGSEFLFENAGGKKGLYIHELFTTGGLNFLRINKPDYLNRYRPFFLLLAYTIPHANNELGARTGNGMQIASDAPYSDQPWPQTEKNKAAMITRLDDPVSQLMDKLKQLKIDDDTIVIFTSDNGPHKEGGVDPKFFDSAGPLRGFKRDLYEGGIRVPLIVRWPAKIKAGAEGRVSDQPWAFWDMLPTLCEVAMVKAPEGLDGISMLPTLLANTQTNQHEFLYWEFHERGFQQAARMSQWKAIRSKPGEPLELYDLATDIGEKKNVAADNPKIVARFEDYLKTARTESEHFPIKTQAAKSAEPK